MEIGSVRDIYYIDLFLILPHYEAYPPAPDFRVPGEAMAQREVNQFSSGMDWSSLPTKPRADLPTSVPFKGRDVAMYTFQQCDRLGKKGLKERSMNMRDLVGAQNLPRFSPGFPDEQMVHGSSRHRRLSLHLAASTSRSLTSARREAVMASALTWPTS